jgi:sugar lactone lactonase YvrE
MMRIHKLLALIVVAVALVPARAQNISTVVGGGPGNNVSPTSVSIGAPAAVRQDSLGDTYLLDNMFSRVLRIDHATGKLSVFAGNGITGYNGDGLPALQAEMFEPSGLCVDADDNVYVADSDNGLIRKIVVKNPAPGETIGNIYNVAGVQTTAYTYSGDGGPATNANLHFPNGCSFDSHGNLYIPDRGNNAIRVVIGPSATPPVGLTGPVTAGYIYLFAGSTDGSTGVAPSPGVAANDSVALGAALNGPFDVFVDSHDNVWIGLVGNPPPQINPPPTAALIREVPASTGGGKTAGHIYTVAGTTSGSGYNGQNIPATSAQITAGQGIYVDGNGNLFFADSVNHVIREVAGGTPPTGMTTGNIYDVAGRPGSRGESGDGGPAVAATLSFPAGTFVDSTGAIFIADSNDNAIRRVDGSTGNYQTETISLFAGNIHMSYGGDGGPGLGGELNAPAGVAIDGAGNLAIADTGNSMIRAVTAPITTGNLITLTGRPENNGFAGDGTPASGALINSSIGVSFDAAGNLFIADTENCTVREISIPNGNIVTIAGSDPAIEINTGNLTPQCGFSGQGGPAKSAMLGKVSGVAVDSQGNVFISDTTNHVIWEVPKNTTTTPAMTAGYLYVIAGTPQKPGSTGDQGQANLAELNVPTGIFIDTLGNLFIADTGNNEIREVPALNMAMPNPMTAGYIYTLAGDHTQAAGYSGDNGLATRAQLNAPASVVVDRAGNLFIADTKNHIIREVLSVTGNIATVAGTPQTPGLFGDGGTATSARLNTPEGLALDGAGDLLIADSANQRVRSIAALATMTPVPVASR